MTEVALAHVARGVRPARVLVFHVDDGLFALHIDWVEALLPRSAVELHSAREAGRSQLFLLHAGEPALLVELRDAFGLTPVLGTTSRRELLIARSPAFHLALPVDGCAGIRELDLDAQPPVPTSLTRDGGFPVGHLVTLDGQPAVILDPSHLLEARERDALVPLAQKARAFRDREAKSEGIWRELCVRPSALNLRAYARLCSRNGRTKAAAAARLVLRHLELGRGADVVAAPGAEEPPPEERFIHELVCLSIESSTGELIVPQADGDESRVSVEGGCVVEVRHGAERGRAAFKRLLATWPAHFYFVETLGGHTERRVDESTAALLIRTLEALGQERRPRRSRAAAA